MKRFMYLSIGVLCFAASMLSTSPSEAKPVKSAIGLQGGVNLSGFESGRIGSIAPDYRWRGIVGLYGRIGFHEKAAIQLECLYSQKGGQGAHGGSEYRLEYFEVPVLLLAMLPFQEGLYIISGGVYISYLADARYSSTAWGIGDADANHQFEEFDFGGILGLGMLIPANPLEFSFNARVVMGLTPITEEWAFERGESKGRNFVYSFFVGVGYPF